MPVHVADRDHLPAAWMAKACALFAFSFACDCRCKCSCNCKCKFSRRCPSNLHPGPGPQNSSLLHLPALPARPSSRARITAVSPDGRSAPLFPRILRRRRHGAAGPGRPVRLRLRQRFRPDEVRHLPPQLPERAASTRATSGTSIRRRCPQAELAWASFPCQDLSLAGERRGLNAPRSGAFWGFWNVIEKLGDRAPRTLVIENVAGLSPRTAAATSPRSSPSLPTPAIASAPW